MSRSGQNDGWGRREQSDQNGGNRPHQPYSPRPPPKHGHVTHHQQHPYASTNRGPPPHQWHHGSSDVHGRDYYGMGMRDHREGEFRRQSMGNAQGVAMMPVCKFFKSGFCRDGQNCRYRHEEAHNNVPDYYGRPSDRHADSRSVGSERHALDTRSLGSDRHGADNRAVSTDKHGIDEYGRHVSPKGGGHQSNHEKEPQRHNFARSDSNRYVGSNNKSGANGSGSVSNSVAVDHQPSPDADSGSKWSKVKLNEVPAKKSKGKPATAATDSSPKKTIKWSGKDQTEQIKKRNYCNRPGHNHLWSECPENKFGRNYKPHPPKLTVEESNAMYRAALENAAAASDKPAAAPPDMMAKSINSLNGTSNLRNNTLKQPPVIVPSKTSTVTSAKPATGSNASAAIPRRNSNATALLKKNSSELQRKKSLVIDTAASKLQAAGHQLKTPTSQNVQQQQKTFVPRSQRAMAKRPSPDQPSPTNKKRKASVLSLGTSPVGRHQMTKKNGHWKKVSVDVAPAANDVIPLTKHTSTRLLNTMTNPFDVLDQEDARKEAQEDSGDAGHAGTNVDFDSAIEDHPSETSPNSASNSAPAAKTNSPEVICLNSSSDEDDDGDDEMDDQPMNSAPAAKEKEIEAAADIVDDYPTNSASVAKEKEIEATADKIDGHPTRPPSTDVTEESNEDHADHMQEDSIEDTEQVQNNVEASHILNNEDNESIPDITVAEDAPVSSQKEGHGKYVNDLEKTINSDTPSQCTVSEEEDSDVRERKQCQVVFTDAQIEEMESDLLDYFECCAKNVESSNSLSSEDDSTFDDESSVSDESCAEESDVANEQTTQADGYQQTKSNKTSSQYTSGSGNSNTPSANTSSVTTSPLLADECGNEPVEGDAVDGEFEAYYTCNYCQLVFQSFEKADDHEKMCSFEGDLGSVFHDNLELCQYIKGNADGKCYFKPSASKPVQDKTQTATWEMKYNAVMQFHKDHGHLNLPREPTDSLGNLYQWLHQQKYKLRKNKLKRNRANKIQKLFGAENANLVVSSAQPTTKEGKKEQWDNKFRAIRKFFKEKDHLNLPDEETAAGLGNLRKWLNHQRGKLRAGKLGPKHAKKLKKLLDQEDNFCVMQSVEHSTDLSTGFPQETIVFIDTSTELEPLHQFKTEVRQSSIAGAGLGVFLTYDGAKVLKPAARARSSKLMEKHVRFDSLIHHPLSAVDQYNNPTTVKVTPNSIFPNEKNHLITKKRSTAYDKHLKKNSCSDFNYVACSVHDEIQMLRSNIPENERIGPLGINTIEDYVPDDSVMFWSNNMIELGRYGPFRPEDRKPELFLNIKNFLFEYEPSEWLYEIDEPERSKRARNEDGKKRKMMIDITDDTTGQVHELARQYSSIYVNETGHSPDLHENVFISTNGEAGAVYYYISIDEQHAMKKGDTVELLVNYGLHYEDIRERKGYGLKNQREGLGGDAEDKAARMQRNFHEREQAEHDIEDLGFIELYLMVRFVTEKIFLPIKSAMHESLSNSRHIIARRRMHWLIKIIERRLEVLLQNRNAAMTTSLVKQLRDWIRAWTFNHEMINPQILQAVIAEGGKQVKDAIRDEITEELFYECCKGPSPLITSPVDKSVWSKIAIGLMTHCAVNIASYIFSGSRGNQKPLATNLLKGARDSTTAVKRASRIINSGSDAPDFDKALSFLALKPRSKESNQSGITCTHHFRSSIYQLPPLPYEDAAILAEYQAYHDAIDLCHLDCQRAEPKAILAEPTDSQLTLISKYHTDSIIDPTNVNQSHAIPRTVDAIRRKVAQVDAEWYLLHHVVLVVHALASLVDWNDTSSSDGQPHYTLEKLCAEVGIDKHKAEAIVKRGCTIPVRTLPRSPQKARKSTDATPTKKKGLGHRTSPRSPASKKTKIPKAKAGKSAKKSKSSPAENRIVKDEPDPNFPGWNVRSIARLSDRTHIDNVWYKPAHKDIVIRSQTGVKAITHRMKETGEDFVSACTHFFETNGKAYFTRSPTSSSRKPKSS